MTWEISWIAQVQSLIEKEASLAPVELPLRSRVTNMVLAGGVVSANIFLEAAKYF